MRGCIKIIGWPRNNTLVAEIKLYKRIQEVILFKFTRIIIMQRYKVSLFFW